MYRYTGPGVRVRVGVGWGQRGVVDGDLGGIEGTQGGGVVP